MSKPVAVLISDIHFSVATLEVATEALCIARNKAHELHVPLVLAGDTLDTKAIVRGEVIKRLISIFQTKARPDDIYVLVGNHDQFNEKSEEHSLEFLKPFVNVVDGKTVFRESISGDLCTPIKTLLPTYLIPYHSDGEKLKIVLYNLEQRNPAGATLIMHTGVHGANMGHYSIDNSSLLPEVFANFRVISGHYHCRQDIVCGRPRRGATGLFSYLGNPYTLGFGEANDGPKGYNILMNDGSLEFVPLNLRKHVIVDCDNFAIGPLPVVDKNDIVWVKIRGERSELLRINKKDIANFIGIDKFKLDLIPIDAPKTIPPVSVDTHPELMDHIIDTEVDTNDEKTYLKGLWRELNETS